MPDKAFTSQKWLYPAAYQHSHICTWMAAWAPPWWGLRPQPGLPLPHALAQALGTVGFPWSLSLDPAPPHPPRSLNPLVGLPWPPAPYLPWDSPDFRFLETVVQLGSLPAVPVVSLSWSPSPSAARLSAQALPRSPASWQVCPSFLDRLRLGSLLKPATWSLQVGPRLWGVQSPFCPQTGLLEAPGWAPPAPGATLCGRRAGGEALTWRGRLSPSRSLLLASSPPIGAPQPFLINGPRCTQGRGPSPGQAGRSAGVWARLNGGARADRASERSRGCGRSMEG